MHDNDHHDKTSTDAGNQSKKSTAENTPASAIENAGQTSNDTLRSLRESEELFRTLYTNLPGGMVVIGKDYRIKNVNQRTCDVTGYTREELIGSLCDIICPKGSESKNCPIWEVGQIGFEGMDTFVKTRDLTMNPVLKNARRVMVNGEEHILEVFQDIRQQKETEEALRKSEARMNSIFSAASIGIGIVQNNQVQIVNDKFCELTGYTREELIGESTDKVFFSQEENRSIKELVNNELVELQSITREVQFRRKDGAIIDIMLSLARLDSEDDSKGVTFTVLDITDQKLAEAEREHLREQYYQAMKLESIGRLAGGVAHDLNNLLTPILGYADLLMMQDFPQHSTSGSYHLDDDEDPYEPVKQIVKAATRAKGLVGQLLAFSRKQALKFDRIELNNLIEQFEKLLRRTIREDIIIEKKLNDNPLVSKGDIGQLEQVIMNLAVNAQDAMTHGGVLNIRTGVEYIDHIDTPHDEAVEPGQYNMIEVSDTGHGMDSETIRNIFEPFFTTKSIHKGTGLGLATVYGIVKQHNGAIAVESKPGLGASFKVYLPIAAPKEEKKTSKAPERLMAHGDETILLVEDNEQVRYLARSILDLHGYKVIEAQSGAEAIDKLEALDEPIDLLVTDVVMPKMNGRQLYEHIQQLQPGVPALFMSGYSDDVIAERGVIDSDMNYLHKPFTVKALTTKVREALEK